MPTIDVCQRGGEIPPIPVGVELRSTPYPIYRHKQIQARDILLK